MDNKYIVIPVIEKELGDKTLHIGANIRKRREALGMTQKELGHRVRTCNTKICQIEREIRMPSIPLLAAIADELQCTVADLVK